MIAQNKPFGGHSLPDRYIDTDVAPLIKKDWVIHENRKYGILEFDPKNFNLYLSEKQKAFQGINGFDLYEVLQDRSPLNGAVLDHLLKYPHLIPKEWKKSQTGTLLLTHFFGTIYRDKRGNLYVRNLLFVNKEWCSSCNLLSYGYYFQDPAIILKDFT